MTQTYFGLLTHNKSAHSKNYYLTNIIPDLKDYYKEVSYGAVNITIDDADVYDNNGNWYKLGKTAAYYGKNTSSDGSDNSHQFVIDAVSASGIDVNNYDAVIAVHANDSYQQLTPTNNWDLMTTHAAGKLIVVSESELMGTWAHEIGHTLGVIFKPPYNLLLPDRYGNDTVGTWDLMGSGNWLGSPAGSNPDHMSSFSKEWLLWLKYKSVKYPYTGNFWINSIATMKYGDDIIQYILRDVPNIYQNYYIIETRTNNSAYSRWDTSAPIPQGYNNAVVLYQVDKFQNENTTVNFIDNLTIGNIGSHSSYWDFATLVRFAAIEQRTRIEGTRSLLEMNVEITKFTISNNVGAVVTPEGNLIGYIPGNTPAMSLNGELPLPDFDLHAYTADGRHVGMNYTTGIYETEIPGANASGDLFNGREWIFIPDNVKVQFVVDSRDIQSFLTAYPDLRQVTDGVQPYNLSIVYDSPDSIRYLTSVDQSIQPGEIRKYNYSIVKNLDGTYNVILDDTPPIIFNTTPEKITNNMQILAEYIDNPGGSGINADLITLIIDGIDVTRDAMITRGSISIKPTLNDGLHEILLSVWDNAGNRASAHWNFTLDATPPAIQLSPANGTVFYSNQALTIDYNVTDATAGIASSSATLDGIAVSKGVIIDLRNLSIGSHIIQVIAADNAGNNAESSTTFIVKPLRAVIKIEPHTLNINSSGRWIKAEIEIPGYKANQINISSIRLNGIIPFAIRSNEVEEDDKDDENERDDSLEKDNFELKVKFNRMQVKSIISPGYATLYISGKVNEAAFMGNDTIRVIENHEKDSDHSEKDISGKSEKIDKSKDNGGKS